MNLFRAKLPHLISATREELDKIKSEKIISNKAESELQEI